MFRDNNEKTERIFQYLGAAPKSGACNSVALLGVYAFFAHEKSVFKSLFEGNWRGLPFTETMIMSGSMTEADLSEEDKKLFKLAPFFNACHMEKHSSGINAGPAVMKEAMESLLKNISGVHQDKIWLEKINNTDIFSAQAGISRFSSWLGMYSINQLTEFMKIISAAASKADVDFAIKLDGGIETRGLHATSLCYHRESKSWSIVDINHIDEADELLTDITEVAYRIFRNYRMGVSHAQQFVSKLFHKFKFYSGLTSGVIFETSVFGLGVNKDKILKMVDEIKKKPVFVDMHKISDEKAEAQNNYQFNLVYQAARSGYDQVVKELGMHHANLSDSGKNALTPLGASILAGQYRCILALLHGGVDVNDICIKSEMNMQPMHAAAMYGRGAIMPVLALFGADVNAPGKMGFTPLHYAAISGNVEAINALIELKADVNKQAAHGFMPLHMLAMFGSIDGFISMVSAGANIHAKDEEGITPFAVATLFGHREIVRYLLQLGVDKNEPIIVDKEQLMKSPDLYQIDSKYLAKLIERKLVDEVSDGKLQLTADTLAVLHSDIEMANILRTDPLVFSRAATRHSSLVNLTVFKSEKASVSIVNSRPSDFQYRK